MSSNTTIVWFRDDLRLNDNPAMFHACSNADRVLPVFIFDDQAMGEWRLGGASRWWLQRSLGSLKQQLCQRNSDLLIFSGDSLAILKSITKQTKANQVFWNRRYSPELIEQDKRVKADLHKFGLTAESFPGNLLVEPWKILNQNHLPYKVFTPFYKRLQSELITSVPEVYPEPENIPALPDLSLNDKSIAELRLYVASPDWAAQFSDYWAPGVDTAQKAKTQFVSDWIGKYDEQRDFPQLESTSRLSPHLHFGELSVKQVWLDIWRQGEIENEQYRQAMWAYLRQLVWREFCHYLLFHFPHLDRQPFKKEFSGFAWQHDNECLERWQRGQTGYPLVDAGMRQLWQTGWMHNRVRMVCASFLTKHLLIHWLDGAKWFWDTLVDADLANNSCGWQWVAGCGADAAPYFRIFNPIIQSKKFDARGEYIRRWLPELNGLDSNLIHTPWLAQSATLSNAGIELDKTYPHIIIEHSMARQRALDAYSSLRMHKGGKAL